MSEFKPFHESIVDAIGKADSLVTMRILGQLIEITKIPENHEAIISAWIDQEVRLGLVYQRAVVKSIELQSRQQSEAKVAA